MTQASFFRATAMLVVMLLSACTSGGGRAGRDGGGIGGCSPACGDFEVCCPEGSISRCVNLGTNPNHCGMCGFACSTGQTCVGAVCRGMAIDGSVPPPTDGGDPGMCFPTCSSAQRCCGTTCVNRSVPAGTDGRSDSSFANCGGCGIGCDAERANACASPLGGGAPQCLCGSFAVCPMGQVCTESAGTFTCTDLNNDPMNCGMVGHACNMGETCSAGMCTCGGAGRCAEGQACCSGSCIDTTSDPENCGACGMACGVNGPDCVDGACKCGSAPACRAPTAGMFPLPGDPGESCCDSACVANTTDSCACMACAADEDCVVAGGIVPGSGGGVCCSSDPFGLSCGGLPVP